MARRSIAPLSFAALLGACAARPVRDVREVPPRHVRPALAAATAPDRRCADAAALRARGERLDGEGRLERATALFAKARALCASPETGGALLRALVELRRDDDARRVARELAASPDATARHEAAAAVERLDAPRPDATALLREGLAASARGDAAVARRTLDRALTALEALVPAAERGVRPGVTPSLSALSTWSPDGRRVQSEGMVLDRATGQWLDVSPCESGAVWLSATRLACPTAVIDVERGELIMTLPGGGRVAAAAGGRVVIVQSADAVTLVDVDARRELATFPGELHGVAPGGAALLVVDGRVSTRGVVLVDARTGASTEVSKTDTVSAHSLVPQNSFSRDGAMLAIPGATGASIVDVAARATVATLSDPRCRGARYIAWAPDGKRLASAWQGDLCVWDVARRKLLYTVALPEKGNARSYKPLGTPSYLGFSPDGATLIEATDEPMGPTHIGYLHLFRAATGAALPDPTPRRGLIVNLPPVALGDRTLVFVEMGATVVAKLESEARFRSFAYPEDLEIGFRPLYSPDGAWLATKQGIARAMTGAMAVRLLDLEPVAFSPRSDALATSSAIHEVPSGRVVFAVESVCQVGRRFYPDVLCADRARPE